MELYLRKLRCIAHKFHLANSKTLHKLTFWYDFWLTFHLRILINCPFWSPLVRVMMVLIKDIVYHCCGHGHGHCSIIVCIFNTFPSVRDETRAWGFHVQHQENSKQSASKTERCAMVWFTRTIWNFEKKNFYHSYQYQHCRNWRLPFKDWSEVILFTVIESQIEQDEQVNILLIN